MKSRSRAVAVALRKPVWLLALSVFASSVLAGERRDIVFDCPCSAEWVAGDPGEPGTLTLRAGIRNLRATESGKMRLSTLGSRDARVESIPARHARHGEWTVALAEPEREAVVEVHLLEEEEVHLLHLTNHERLALWPVPTEGEGGPRRFVDILTDSDGDGVGDVNERLARTADDDAASTPRETEIDVLALYAEDFIDLEAGHPYTHLLHVMNVTGVVFENSGTNVRLRIVGTREVELDEEGWVEDEVRQELMDGHGADLTVQFSTSGGCSEVAAGCAVLGAAGSSHWSDARVWAGFGSALLVAHELGHAMGLAHSARQGETHGAWRWSRGHYVTPRGESPRWGTVMSYGGNVLGGVFSDPLADCGGVACGVPVGEIGGADAVTTLDRMRFQVAAHRAPARDTDGDGIVDAADALPEDPNDWIDIDGDGIGDSADPDDDNDGVEDVEDAFPLDPEEWVDADRDGIGDNADEDVQDLSPFRDPALRAAVEEELGKEAGAAITAEEMASLTRLWVWGRDIADLTGLDLATGLEVLGLPANRIDDLGPLAGLTELRTLRLEHNSVADLSPLAGLSALADLDLSENPVGDISVLAQLDELRVLLLDDTQVAVSDILALPYFDRMRGLGLGGLGVHDLSVLADLPLRQLNLSDNEIAEIGALAGMAEMRWLYLAGNEIEDISPLSGMTGLQSLDLRDNRVADVGALADIADLSWLNLRDNRIAEVGALADMVGMRWLYLGGNEIEDISPLSGMTGLRSLDLRDNRVADVGALEDMPEMNWLNLGENRIAEVGALADLVGVSSLYLHGNDIEDISPLSGMTALRTLSLRDNRIAEIGALAGMVEMSSLYLHGNDIEDISPLSGMTALRTLNLRDNRIAEIGALADMAEMSWLYLHGNDIEDISPLSEMRAFRTLNLRDNRIEDIGPLVDQAIFGESASAGAWLYLDGNPLNEASVEEHIATLRSWGVNVRFGRRGSGAPAPAIADPTLRALVAEALSGGSTHVDDERQSWPFDRLSAIALQGRGVTSLKGLEGATNLESVWAASNGIVDVSPLAELAGLSRLDLRDNRIADLAPLAANAHLAEDDWLALDGNPLSEKSLNVHVPALLKRGVEVSVDRVELALVAGGEPLRYDTAGYFEARLGAGVSVSAASDDASLATVEMDDGVLVVTPGANGGTATVRVEASGANGTATLSFAVIVRGAWLVPLFASASDALRRQGFVRVVNRGPAGEVEVVAVDDTGMRAPPLTLEIGVGETVHFNSEDLETGNTGKGLKGSSGPGTGHWRLELRSRLDLDVLAYIRTPDGFLTAMHDIAPETRRNSHHVPIFNPASNVDQVSALRLVNLGGEAARATVTGVDDRGRSPGGSVRVEVPPGAALTLTASDLESGTGVSAGALGDGAGKWRLRVASQGDLAVLGLLSSPAGHLTNLSTAAPAALDGVHTVPLFPSASDALGRQGFVRVINRSSRRGEVRVRAFDDTGRAYEPLTLSIGSNQVAHFNSDDLELGNVRKGLQGSTGSGTGDWRLELSADLDMEVLAYIRTASGFLTSMHDQVAGSGRRYDAVTFNPGSNQAQVSRLRIANPGSVAAHVSVAGVDDAGDPSAEVVRFEVPPGAARTLTAADLESGNGVRGRLGDGTGKWRLTADSEQRVVVMSLLSSPTGHLANLSTRPDR